MTLPASGNLSFSAVQTEFGGSNPISLSEYYRSGAYVPNVSQNAAVPTSGTFAMSTLYGTVAYIPDYIPDAFNINSVMGDGINSVSAESNVVTITGISEPITLLFKTTDGEVNYSRIGGGTGTSAITLTIVVNGVAANTMSWSRTTTGQTLNITDQATVTISNNQTLQVMGDFYAGILGEGSGGASANVFITNLSSANTLLDSFPVQMSATFSDGGIE